MHCCVSTNVHLLHSVSADERVSSAQNVQREKDTKPHQPQQSVTQHREEELRRELSREREASAHLRQLVTQNESTVQQLLTDTSQQISRLRQEKNSQTQQLQQQLAEVRREKEAQIQQHQQQLADVRRDKEAQIQQLQLHLSDVRRDNEHLHQGLVPNTSPIHSQEIEFWHVSPEEVQVGQEILGRGAWGFVAKGKFRGQRVAVKQVYPDILQQTTMDRIRREIRTMAQVRHPNLVLFIAAVIDDRTGPMIITEILDTSLRSAYERNRLGSNKLRIFQDVASALNYLHLH